eukprot:44948_1
MTTFNTSNRKRNIVNLDNQSYPERKRYKIANSSTISSPNNVQIAYINAHNKLIENISQLPSIIPNNNHNNNNNNSGYNCNSKPNIPLCPPIPLPPLFLVNNNNNNKINTIKKPIKGNAFADNNDDDDDIPIYPIKKPNQP